MACEGTNWQVEFRCREEGAVDGRGPGTGGEDEMGTGKGCGFVGRGVHNFDRGEWAGGFAGEGNGFSGLVEVDVAGEAGIQKKAAE